MNKKVVWSRRAKTDILEIKRFFDDRNKSNQYSTKLLRTFKHAANFIEKHPLASVSTDYEKVRGFIILDYTIFYEILDKHILILTVWDNRRNKDPLISLFK